MSAPAAAVAWSAVDVPPAFDVGALGREAHGERPIDSPHATVTAAAALMGGQVAVSLRATERSLASWDAERVLARIGRWADRLTRFSPDSDLSRVNRDPRQIVPLTPTLAAILDWARSAELLTDGIVDVAWLDARLAAEGLAPSAPRPGHASRAWSLDRADPRQTSLRRPVGLRLDLDGVAKGWLADRALARLSGYGTALVDADGDIALRVAPGDTWSVGVAHPTEPNSDLMVLALVADGSWPRTFGIATSGTSVHRWTDGQRTTHHLIDPRTGRPALTDLTQATVIAGSARHAEALAKAAVILGTRAAVPMLERHAAAGAILVGEGGVTVLDATRAWLS